MNCDPVAGERREQLGHVVELDVGRKCEYVVPVNWIKTVARESSFWEPNLFANQNTAARLRDTDTIARLERHFGLTGTKARAPSKPRDHDAVDRAAAEDSGDSRERADLALPLCRRWGHDIRTAELEPREAEEEAVDRALDASSGVRRT